MGISFNQISGDIVQFIANHADETTVVILPTQRLVRKFVEQTTKTIATAKLFTYEEFFDSLIDTGGVIPVDWFIKSMLLRQAIARVKRAKLILKDDFERIRDITHLEAFLSDLIGFYEEVSVEQVDFNDLKQKGVYTDYETHIAVLDEVLSEYKKLLKENGFADIGLIKHKTAITVPANITAVYIAVSGFLTNYEISAIKKLSKVIDIHITLKNRTLPTKMKEILSKLDFKPKAADYPKPVIFVNKFFSYTDMALWILKTVREEHYRNHTRLEEIRVVLPDESIAAILRSIDREQFNFANGFSITDSVFYSYFNIVYDIVDGQTKNGYKTGDIIKLAGHPFALKGGSAVHDVYRQGLPRNNLPSDMEEQLVAPIKLIYSEKSVSIQSVSRRLLELFRKLALNYENARMPPDYHSAKDKLSDELEKLSLLNKDYITAAAPGKDMLSYILKRLGSARYTDVGIGRVKVMGVLESRLLNSEVVIVPSLNDGILPNISKDPFLNSTIRSQCGLPTAADREELQRYYFEGIINSSNRVYLSYINDDESQMSRFLFDVVNRNRLKIRSVSGLSNYLFDKKQIYEKAIKTIPGYAVKNDEIIRQLKDTEYSSTSLDAYRLCPYKFYLKYVKKIKEKIDLKEQPFEIGKIVHKVFARLFMDGKPINNERQIIKSFENELNNLVHSNPIIDDNPAYKVRLDYFLYRVKHSGFLKKEAACNAEKIVTESAFKINLEGAAVAGRIDRVDIYENSFEIIDYKTGKIEQFRGIDKYYSVQLPLYGYVESLKTHKNCSGLIYYNLQDFKREYWMEPAQISNAVDDIKRVIVEIFDININFTKSDRYCKYCCYKLICRRG